MRSVITTIPSKQWNHFIATEPSHYLSGLPKYCIDLMHTHPSKTSVRLQKHNISAGSIPRVLLFSTAYPNVFIHFNHFSQLTTTYNTFRNLKTCLYTHDFFFNYLIKYRNITSINFDSVAHNIYSNFKIYSNLDREACT